MLHACAGCAGYGGSKKLRKQNDSYSAAAVDGAKQGRFNGGGKPKGGALACGMGEGGDAGDGFVDAARPWR